MIPTIALVAVRRTVTLKATAVLILNPITLIPIHLSSTVIIMLGNGILMNIQNVFLCGTYLS